MNRCSSCRAYIYEESSKCHECGADLCLSFEKNDQLSKPLSSPKDQLASILVIILGVLIAFIGSLYFFLIAVFGISEIGRGLLFVFTFGGAILPKASISTLLAPVITIVCGVTVFIWGARRYQESTRSSHTNSSDTDGFQRFAPVDVNGLPVRIGNKVRISTIPAWLTDDLSAKDQDRLKSFTGTVALIAEIARFGSLSFPPPALAFCLRPEDVRRV